MAAESSGRGGLKTTKVHKSKTSTSQSTATVATTTKKKSNGTAKKEEEFIKLVIRRLPSGMIKEEFWEQIQPLPNEPLSFWFCPAASNTDREIPRAATFSRAYVAFREEKDAVALAERFNGYMFVDKQGNESMAIVECAPNQNLPKDLARPAKECDIRTGTLENEMQYQQFLEAYEQRIALGNRRVTNFDELVRELQEKERRMATGQVQETPLTVYISQMGLEKNRKKQQRLVERLERRQQKQQKFAHQIVTTDWAEVYRKEGIEIVTNSNSGNDGKKEKKQQRKNNNQKQERKNNSAEETATSLPKQSTKNAAVNRNRDRPEREIYRPRKARLQSRKAAEEQQK